MPARALSVDIPEEKKEIVERLNLARRYKAETYGGEITPVLFRDSVDYAGSYTARSLREISEEARKSYQQAKSEQGLKSSVTQAEGLKKRSGGIIGICEIRPTVDGRKRWQASKGGTTSAHYCAIEAAIERNNSMDRLKPGIDAFQCELKAVWRRWGCTCGNHKKCDLT